MRARIPPRRPSARAVGSGADGCRSMAPATAERPWQASRPPELDAGGQWVLGFSGGVVWKGRCVSRSGGVGCGTVGRGEWASGAVKTLALR
jgi:hypothetical protein